MVEQEDEVVFRELTATAERELRNRMALDEAMAHLVVPNLGFGRTRGKRSFESGSAWAAQDSSAASRSVESRRRQRSVRYGLGCMMSSSLRSGLARRPRRQLFGDIPHAYVPRARHLLLVPQLAAAIGLSVLTACHTR